MANMAYWYYVVVQVLVLYWFVNNVLSIAQQARINHLIHAAALAKKKGNAVR